MTARAALLLLVVLAAPVHAQVQATTTDGRVVVLYPDGTWKLDASANVPKPTLGTRPAKATASLDILRGKATIYYDSAVWRPTKSNDVGKSSFTHANGDGYAVVISERIEVSEDALRRIALKNAQAAAPNARVVSEERRLVNGSNVIEMEIRGTIEGIDFVYLGYYSASATGTIQVLTYTSANLFAEYRPAFQAFLDGLVVR